MDCSPEDISRAEDLIVLRPAGRPDSVPYFLYRPPGAGPGARPLVTLHGISRNAMEHMEAFAPLARASGRPLLAPLFTLAAHRRYQLAVSKDGRTDHVLLATLAAFAGETGCAVDQIDLFGFSGGAQLAHRFAMLRPERVDRLVLSSAGWYTFPTPEDRYPYGLGGPSPAGPEITANLERFLPTPMLVLVGALDTARDAGLRKKPIVDDRQGRNRVQRAQRWAAAVTALAASRRITANVAVETLPDCGHSFADCVARGGLVEKVGRWFGIAV